MSLELLRLLQRLELRVISSSTIQGACILTFGIVLYVAASFKKLSSIVRDGVTNGQKIDIERIFRKSFGVKNLQV